MGFRLRIVEGKGAGKEFVFQQPSVRIGRAPDNDLVLYDMGVSRHHCELLVDSGAFTLRDTGSANGTLLNEVVTTEGRVHSGDRLQIGPVLLLVEPGVEDAPAALGKRQEEAFGPLSAEQRRSLEEGNTVAVNAAQAMAAAGLRARPRLATRAPTDTALKPRARPGKGGGAPLPLKAEPSARRTETGSFVPVKPQARLPDRLRQLVELPRSTKLAVAFSAVVLLVAVLLSVSMIVNQPELDRSAEILVPDPTLSYGAGKVRVNTPDRVNFQFDHQGGRVTVLFAAGGVDTATEVEVLVNGKPAGHVEPTGGGWKTGLKLRLPRPLLKPGPNILTFDNTLTPARPERWGVAQVRIQEEPLPAQSEARARELYQLATAAYDARSVAPPNLWRAIEYLDEAQLYIEGLEPEPPLLQSILQTEEDAHGELQRIFNETLFTAEKELRFGDREAAVQSIRNMLRYLPEPEHPLHKKAKARLRAIAGADASLE